MAHEFTSTDGLALAVRPAWHGLGVVLPEAPSIPEAFKVAGLGWRVEDRPVFRQLPTSTFDPEKQVWTPTYEQVDGVKELYRGDTKEPYGVVSDGFQVFQNEDLAALAQALAEDGTIPKAESAGSLKGGRRVWLQVQTGTFLAGPRDRVVEYLLFSNAHDGSGAFRVIPTTVRVVCHNTLTAAESRGGDLVRIPHKSGLPAAVRAAKPRILAALRQGETLRGQVQALAARKLSDDDVRNYFRSVFQTLWPDKLAEALNGDRAAAAEVQLILQGWINNLRSPRNIDTGTEGTAWSALNAVTEWAEYERAVRVPKGETADSARAWSRLFGRGQEIKAAALGKALAVLA